MGLIADGELFVAGRSDDQIIVDGMNMWPAELEAVAASETADFQATFLALRFSPDSSSPDKLVIVMECAVSADDQPMLRQKITSAVHRRCGAVPSSLIVVPPPFFERTASGKLDRKRSAMRVASIAGAWFSNAD